MRKTIVITDLTQMPTVDGVCIAGIDQHNNCIRPVLPTGVCRRHLYIGDKLAIRPRAKVTFDLHKVSIILPHIENLGFDPNSIEYLGLCADPEWESVLQASSFGAVEDIYDGHLKEHRWVEPDANVRSLGTVSGVQIERIEFTSLKIPGHYKPRLTFRDMTDWSFPLPVSDLSFRTFADYEIKRRGGALVASKQMLAILQGAITYISESVCLARGSIRVPVRCVPGCKSLGFTPFLTTWRVNHLLTFNFLGNRYRSRTLLSISRNLGIKSGRKKFDLSPECPATKAKSGTLELMLPIKC